MHRNEYKADVSSVSPLFFLKKASTLVYLFYPVSRFRTPAKLMKKATTIHDVMSYCNYNKFEINFL